MGRAKTNQSMASGLRTTTAKLIATNGLDIDLPYYVNSLNHLKSYTGMEEMTPPNSGLWSDISYLNDFYLYQLNPSQKEFFKPDRELSELAVFVYLSKPDVKTRFDWEAFLEKIITDTKLEAPVEQAELFDELLENNSVYLANTLIKENQKSGGSNFLSLIKPIVSLCKISMAHPGGLLFKERVLVAGELYATVVSGKYDADLDREISRSASRVNNVLRDTLMPYAKEIVKNG